MTTKPLPAELMEAIADGINSLGWSPDIPAKTGIVEFELDCHEVITIAEKVYQAMSATHVPKDKVMKLVEALKQIHREAEMGDKQSMGFEMLGIIRLSREALAEFEAETNGGKG